MRMGMSMPALATMTDMDILLNGKPHSCPSGCTVAGLIEQLGLIGKRLAVERNHELVPRALHAQTLLLEGDRVEIVVAVGGG